MKLSTIIIAVTLTLLCSSCAALGALLGGAAGTPLGPPGIIAGAALGAEGGDLIAGSKRDKDELARERKVSEELRAALVEARANARANERILEHNLALPRGQAPVPPIHVPDPTGDVDGVAWWTRSPLSYLRDAIRGAFR